MTSYKALYLRLFGAMEDALEHLERGEISRAEIRMASALRDAEERVMELDIIPDEDFEDGDR